MDMPKALDSPEQNYSANIGDRVITEVKRRLAWDGRARRRTKRLITSTLLTLVLSPVIYDWMESRKEKTA